MMIGDLVRVRDAFNFNGAINMGIQNGDVGVVIGVPLGYGDVVDLMVNGKKIRYWIGSLEVIK